MYNDNNNDNRKQILEIFTAGSIAIFLIIVIRIVFFQVFIIPSDSMYPTLQRGDSLLVLKSPFNTKKINANDIVVFNIYGQSFVKRVVAVEDDTIAIKNGYLFVNGQKNTNLAYKFNRNEKYNIVVGKNNIYVLGDNNTDSVDSRQFGTIETSEVVGKVFLIFSPISRFQFIL